MAKIIFGFELDTETKMFKQIGNTDVVTAMRIMLDVVNEVMKSKEQVVKSESTESLTKPC